MVDFGSLLGAIEFPSLTLGTMERVRIIETCCAHPQSPCWECRLGGLVDRLSPDAAAKPLSWWLASLGLTRTTPTHSEIHRGSEKNFVEVATPFSGVVNDWDRLKEGEGTVCLQSEVLLSRQALSLFGQGKKEVKITFT